MRQFISLDIGGTDIKYGIINDKGEIFSRSSYSTDIQKGITNLVSNIKNIVRTLLQDGCLISGIGISTAGVVNPSTGEIIYAGPTMPGYTGTNLKGHLEKEFRIPVIIDNDVNAAALGEAWVGAGRSIDTFFCMTLGTGIGGAFVINKELYRGKNFRGGEIGYMGKQNQNDKRYEEKAATSALIKNAERVLNMENIDGQTIFERAKSGNPKYEIIVRDWVEEIAKGIADIICVLDPGVIIMGGAVSQQGKYLMDQIKDGLPSYLPAIFVSSTVLKPAECGNAAGMLGAVYPFVK